MIKQNERQSNRDLGGRHGEDEQKHHLPIRLRPTRSRCDEGEAASVEHDLNAHQREDEITPREKSREPQREQDRRENQDVLCRYR